MTLYTYQKEGVQFLRARAKAYLADDMGLGKTIQAIKVCDDLMANTILVVCPATLKENWAREFEAWGVWPRSISVVHPNQHIVPVSDVTIVNYEMLLSDGKFNQLMMRRYEVIIFDEAHRLKNHKADRTRKALGPKYDGVAGIAGQGDRVYFLSGTPAPNNVSELWTVMRFMTGSNVAYWNFLNRYCVVRNTGFGMKIVGQRNITELRDKLKPVMLRRKSEDVLKDLPPITYQSVSLAPVDVAKMASDKVAWQKLTARFGDALTTMGDDELLKELQKPGDMAILRQLIGVAKAGAVSRLVQQEFEDGLEKIIIFAWHTAVIDSLAQDLDKYGVLKIDGRTPISERQDIVQRFQTDPGMRVMIGNITAAGEGLTMTAANQVLFAEYSWVPKDNAQAAKRAHRIGQTRPVFARFCSFPGTIDDVITKAVARKTAMINQLFEAQDVNSNPG
jgi:SWI/SNF-related matrix-associated actin-dependent regulator 1 of chromatin subfamily A